MLAHEEEVAFIKVWKECLLTIIKGGRACPLKLRELRIKDRKRQVVQTDMIWGVGSWRISVATNQSTLHDH